MIEIVLLVAIGMMAVAFGKMQWSIMNGGTGSCGLLLGILVAGIVFLVIIAAGGTP